MYIIVRNHFLYQQATSIVPDSVYSHLRWGGILFYGSTGMWEIRVRLEQRELVQIGQEITTEVNWHRALLRTWTM